MFFSVAQIWGQRDGHFPRIATLSLESLHNPWAHKVATAASPSEPQNQPINTSGNCLHRRKNRRMLHRLVVNRKIGLSRFRSFEH